ncbi:hypothetical protein [Marinobacter antarcticus]|uniref:Carbohydrate binding domain-containing protein n=1 Tax=Marinobacter antarcticus TaxID=564117 RepID=A0A831R4K5_9GAMM|nr:hypothetical protein [Marinobacter antarcticus]HEA53853.1 hypothetical protein [Marinobacter antarcticus]
MLKKPTFGFRQTLASSLLALFIATLGFAAHAQSNEPVQVTTPDTTKDATITGATGSTSNSDGGTSGGSTSDESTSGICVRPEQWLYAQTYKEGQLASHGGKVWRVIKQNKGDMPGMNTPPRWELVEGHCSVIDPEQLDP